MGGADQVHDFSRAVLAAAAAAPNVVATAAQTGLPLADLLAHVGLFVPPSSPEGLPIALLEALSFGVPCLASAILGNLEVGLDRCCYSPVGDVEALAALIAARCARPATAAERAVLQARAAACDWDKMVAQMLEQCR